MKSRLHGSPAAKVPPGRRDLHVRVSADCDWLWEEKVSGTKGNKRCQERMALSWYCMRATWPIGGR